MATQYNLTAPGVWESIWDESYDAVRPTPGTYAAIPRIDIPIVLQEAVIAVATSSSSAPSRWRYAGRLIQRYAIPGVSAGLVDGQESRAKLNRISLAIFPQIVPDYQLSFEIPPWIQNLSIALWRYTGPVTENLEELIETLKVDIARVEYKIERLV
jgi:hypothetical protein